MMRKEPIHPGVMIRKQIVDYHGLSVTEAAAILRVGRQALSALLNERADLSREMAMRIEKAFGVSMDLLMKMQLAYDLAEMRAREDDIEVSPYIKIPKRA